MKNRTIHLIFLPLVAGLLLAWGYFGKQIALSLPTSTLSHAAANAEGFYNAEGSVHAEGSAHPEGSLHAEGSKQAEGASDPASHAGEAAALNADIAALEAEVAMLRNRQSEAQSSIESNREQRLYAFADSINILRNADVSEFAQHPAQPETATALQDFLYTNEYVRNLNIQVSECSDVGCQLTIPAQYRTISNYMRFNRALIEHGQPQFGRSSLHVIGASDNQQIYLLWQP